jgi:lysylphosphatidylglycerol synthetase-like protein (DUF2156 family)
MVEDRGPCNFSRKLPAIRVAGMILIIALVVLALVTGVLGALIKGAFWLFIFTVVFLIGAFVVGRNSRR